MEAEYELEALLLTGSCDDVTPESRKKVGQEPWPGVRLPVIWVRVTLSDPHSQTQPALVNRRSQSACCSPERLRIRGNAVRHATRHCVAYHQESVKQNQPLKHQSCCLKGLSPPARPAASPGHRCAAERGGDTRHGQPWRSACGRCFDVHVLCCYTHC
jgi:hypothetical protein